MLLTVAVPYDPRSVRGRFLVKTLLRIIIIPAHDCDNMRSAVIRFSAFVIRIIISAFFRERHFEALKIRPAQRSFFYDHFFNMIPVGKAVDFCVLQMRNRAIALGFVQRLQGGMCWVITFMHNTLPRCKRSEYTIIISTCFIALNAVFRSAAVTWIIGISRRTLTVGKPYQMRFGKIKAAVRIALFDHVGFNTAHRSVCPAGAADLQLDRCQDRRGCIPPVKACRQFCCFVR